MKKTVLLTGASGLVGEQALKALINQKEKYHIRVFDLKTNRSQKVLNKYKNDVQIFYGDITNIEDIKKAITEVDYVIHLAAIIPPLADKNKKLAKKVNINGTKNIINAIKEENKNIFLTYASSISVYGDRLEDFNIEVTDRLKASPGDYYAVTKIECEKMIKKAKLGHTIFRLTGVMSNPKTNPLMFHMPLNTRFEIITSRDAGYAFANSINHIKELNKKVFNLSGGEECRVIYKDFLKKNLDIYGLDFNKIPESAFATKDFHCGYYLDSNELNDILHHQRDTLEEYYSDLLKNTDKSKTFFTKLFSASIIRNLVLKSASVRSAARKSLRKAMKMLRRDKK